MDGVFVPGRFSTSYSSIGGCAARHVGTLPQRQDWWSGVGHSAWVLDLDLCKGSFNTTALQTPRRMRAPRRALRRRTPRAPAGAATRKRVPPPCAPGCVPAQRRRSDRSPSRLAPTNPKVSRFWGVLTSRMRIGSPPKKPRNKRRRRCKRTQRPRSTEWLACPGRDQRVARVEPRLPPWA